jgi:hypothetical protein
VPAPRLARYSAGGYGAGAGPASADAFITTVYRSVTEGGQRSR